MAKINDLLDDVTTDQQAYYEEPDNSEIPEGTYQGTVVALSRKLNRVTKSGNVCDTFWMRYKISTDSPTAPGRLVRDAGLFRFRKGLREKNLFYKEALDRLEIPLEKKSIDGKIRYILPALSSDMVVGKNVIFNVYYDEWKDAKGHHKLPVAKIVKVLKEIDGNR